MPKIIGSSLEEHRERTRVRVFEALTSLLAQRPFAAISMADLAAEAGVGRTALYNHFRDKDAVVVAFATDETRRYVNRLQHELEGVESPEDRMRTYVRHHLDTAEQMHFGLGPELHATLSPEAFIELRDHVVDVEQVLQQIIQDGVASGAFRVNDVGSALALVHACLQAKRADAATTEAFVLRGLGA
ncbi:MAG: TetR/AcrR family transcriptional regulator [Actinomycetales bacterium]|nr:MAG: TetR/AcrR family transcriptional regulator [Actinomycetales bacterium]